MFYNNGSEELFMFGIKHIIMLVISFLYIIGGYFLIRKLKQKTVISIALILVAS